MSLLKSITSLPNTQILKKKRHYTKFNLANCSSITPSNYIFFTKGVIQEVNEVSAIICYWDQVIHKYVFLDEQYYKLVPLMTHTPTFETKKRSSFLWNQQKRTLELLHIKPLQLANTLTLEKAPSSKPTKISAKPNTYIILHCETFTISSYFS